MRLNPQNSTILGIFSCVFGMVLLLLASQTWVNGPFVFQSRRWELIFWIGAVSLLLGIVFVLFAWIKKTSVKQDIVLPSLLNIIVIAIIWVLAEVTLSIIAKPHPLGKKIGNTILMPYDWNSYSSFNLGLYENSKSDDAFYIGHERLGWTVGNSRKSKDGLYVSSKNGLRSGEQGEDLFNRPHKSRIALYGDSFMFSEEVGYEQSLQFHMQKMLPPNTQVLSFGVPGYGIDQAVLRYDQEGEKWNSKIVVFAFIRDNLYRSLNIYTGLKPGWGIPFSKPRLLNNDGNWEVINIPNITPENIYTSNSVAGLPEIEHEIEYVPYFWKKKPLDWSILFRFLYSIYPPWNEPGETTNEQVMLQLAGYLSSKFTNLALERNAIPLVVYLPSKSDFVENKSVKKEQIFEEIKSQNIHIYDATECLLETLNTDVLYVEGGTHYSDSGNKVLANCLLQELELKK